jgi:acetyl esterase/lipase
MIDTPLNDLHPEAFRQFLLASRTDEEEPRAEARARQDLRGLATPLPAGCEKVDVDAGGVAAERLTPAGAAADRAILYLHGGGFVQGSPRSIRHFAARLADAARVGALVPEYRLAPEHPHPAGLEDAVASYRWLLDQGLAPERIAFAGDSAGGGLAVAAVLAATRQGLPRPAAVHAISPWVDLTQTSPSHAIKRESDILCTVPDLERMSRDYRGAADVADPLVSPIHADLTGFPPLYIQVGSEEVLLCDSTRLAERAALAKVAVRLEVYPEMLHSFPVFHEHLAPARRAIREAGAWLAERLQRG